jgi:hypothetical protein
MTRPTRKIALIDFDGTLCNYDQALDAGIKSCSSPEQYKEIDKQLAAHRGRDELEEMWPWFKNLVKMVKAQPDWWFKLEKLPTADPLISRLKEIGFTIRGLTAAPYGNPDASAQKLRWFQANIDPVISGNGSTIMLGRDKALVYGRVLFDDWPSYFLPWLKSHPRGIVFCPAWKWNDTTEVRSHPRVIRYDPMDPWEWETGSSNTYLLHRIYERAPKQSLLI